MTGRVSLPLNCTHNKQPVNKTTLTHSHTHSHPINKTALTYPAVDTDMDGERPSSHSQRLRRHRGDPPVQPRVIYQPSILILFLPLHLQSGDWRTLHRILLFNQGDNDHTPFYLEHTLRLSCNNTAYDI